MNGFASDQSPKKDKARHWNDFMGINVPVHTGAEIACQTVGHARRLFSL